MAHIAVVVLGDTGRSPRMQYHALSFANLNETNRVSLIGYKGEQCIESINTHEKINDIRINNTIELPFLLNKIPMLSAIWKGISILFSILYTLAITIPYYDSILIQNPPALPALLAALIIELLPGRNSIIILDWHNLGFAMFQEKYDGNKKHPLVVLSKFLE